jgi:hypothetical protein
VKFSYAAGSVHFTPRALRVAAPTRPG